MLKICVKGRSEWGGAGKQRNRVAPGVRASGRHKAVQQGIQPAAISPTALPIIRHGSRNSRHEGIAGGTRHGAAPRVRHNQ